MTTSRACSQWTLAVVLVAVAGATHAAFADTAAHAAATEASRRLVTGYARLLFVQHDSARAFRDYFSPQLVQHDPDIADGDHGDEDFLSRRRKAHPEQYLPIQAYATVVDNILATVTWSPSSLTSTRIPTTEVGYSWTSGGSPTGDSWSIGT